MLSNLRLDQYERTQIWKGNMGSACLMLDFYLGEFWRSVFLPRKIAEFAPTSIEYPPIQKVASFNLAALKEQPQKAAAAHTGE